MAKNDIINEMNDIQYSKNLKNNLIQNKNYLILQGTEESKNYNKLWEKKSKNRKNIKMSIEDRRTIIRENFKNLEKHGNKSETKIEKFSMQSLVSTQDLEVQSTLQDCLYGVNYVKNYYLK